MGTGAHSKPRGKLAKSQALDSPALPPQPVQSLPAPAEKSSREISLDAEGGGKRAGAHAGARRCTREPPGFKGEPRAAPTPVESRPSPALEFSSQDSYSFTESDLATSNSFLRSSFPSLASSTQSANTLIHSVIKQSTALSSPLIGADTFISAGAGPHCPLTYPEEEMGPDSSLVTRGNRFRQSVTKVSNLSIFGVDHGPEVLDALRMVFKSYEPAVALSKRSLKDPSYAEIGSDLEKFALLLMEHGEVTDPSDLFMLTEVLLHVKQVLGKVLARPDQVSRLLAAQRVAKFALGGPVMRQLDAVLAWLEKLEEEERVDDAIIAADFEADSFQEREAPQLVQRGGGVASGRTEVAASALTSSDVARGRFAEEGDQVEI